MGNSRGSQGSRVSFGRIAWYGLQGAWGNGWLELVRRLVACRYRQLGLDATETLQDSVECSLVGVSVSAGDEKHDMNDNRTNEMINVGDL